MTFVNEYASDDDIEKYDLNGIWDKYHPVWKGDYYLGQKPKFTIDRENNIFYMVIAQGREDLSHRTTALLWINGYRVVFELDKIGGLNKNGQKSSPYRIGWELAGYHPQIGIPEKKKQY